MRRSIAVGIAVVAFALPVRPADAAQCSPPGTACGFVSTDSGAPIIPDPNHIRFEGTGVLVGYRPGERPELVGYRLVAELQLTTFGPLLVGRGPLRLFDFASGALLLDIEVQAVSHGVGTVASRVVGRDWVFGGRDAGVLAGTWKATPSNTYRGAMHYVASDVVG